MTRMKWGDVVSIWDWLEHLSGRAIVHESPFTWVAYENGVRIATAASPQTLQQLVVKR